MKKWSKIIHYLKNKYILTLIIFFVWILLFDSNNLVDRFSQMKSLKQLEEDKEYYLKRIEEDSKKLNELETDKKNLEKFAREQYLMKKENEEIFIVIDEDEEKDE
jgi:cell division protein DivIC